DREPVLDDLAVWMIEARIYQTCAHPLWRLAPTRNEIEEVLAVFGGPEDESRGQEDGWFDGSFRQLRIVAVVHHQRFLMQRVIADVGLRRKRFHHGLSRCLEGTSSRACSTGRINSRCATTPGWADRARWHGHMQSRFHNRRR